MQQEKIIPAISTSWAIFLYIDHLFQLYQNYQDQMTSPSKATFELLAEIHSHSTGLKALAHYNVEKFGERIKQACGGHGYMKVAGLSDLHFVMGFGMVTAEGDNVVMLQ